LQIQCIAAVRDGGGPAALSFCVHLVAFEKLHLSFVLLRGGHRIERS
jgi:hypothetical protein